MEPEAALKPFNDDRIAFVTSFTYQVFTSCGFSCQWSQECHVLIKMIFWEMAEVKKTAPWQLPQYCRLCLASIATSKDILTPELYGTGYRVSSGILALANSKKNRLFMKQPH